MSDEKKPRVLRPAAGVPFDWFECLCYEKRERIKK